MINDRPNLTRFVLVADLVQHEPLAPAVAHPEVPLLPGHGQAVKLEARAVGLTHDQRLRRRARCRRVTARRRVDRPDSSVSDVNHLGRVHVDRDDHTLDRPVIRIGKAAPVEAQRTRKARRARINARLRYVAKRPPVEVHVGWIYPALAHRRLPGRVGHDDVRLHTNKPRNRYSPERPKVQRRRHPILSLT